MNYKLFQVINNLAGQNHFRDKFMVLMSNYGLYLFVILLLVLWLTRNEENQRTVVLTGIAGILSLAIINPVIGTLYYHARPFVDHSVHQLIAHPNDNSFPSDHATAAFVLALTIFARKRILGVWMILLAAVIGFSRIYVGVHYPLDVLGGIAVALVSSFLVIKCSRVLEPVFQLTVRIYGKVASILPFLPVNEPSLENQKRHL